MSRRKSRRRRSSKKRRRRRQKLGWRLAKAELLRLSVYKAEQDIRRERYLEAEAF